MGSLYFYREGFISGQMIIYDREKNAEGTLEVVKKIITPREQKRKIQFSDPDYVIEKHPKFFYKRKPKQW